MYEVPFKSKAQQRKFYADPKLKKHRKKWSDETKKAKGGFKKLPEKIKKHKPKTKKKSTSKARSAKKR